MNKILKEKILSRIKPSLNEHNFLQKKVDEFIFKLENSANLLNIKCNFFIGGSFGKGTYLKGNFDVDIFARFDTSYTDDVLSELLENILKNSRISFKKQKGSRDYFSVFIALNVNKKLEFEIIPNRFISSVNNAINSTDVSPFHVDFLKKKALKNPLLLDEIRLTKQFFKAKELYGAESYINGFSGHVIDILIAHFGSLENLLLDAKNWKEQKVIDVNNFYLNEDDAIKNISEDKISNLIVVDPILKGRNAARALLEEKYYKFLLISQNFTQFTEKDFQIPKKDSKNLIDFSFKFAKENNLELVLYKFDFKIINESEDIVGSKFLKLFGRVNSYFLSYDFIVFKEKFFIDIEKQVCLFIYFFEKKIHSKLKIAIGPKVYMFEDVKNFLGIRKDFFIQDTRVCLYKKREVISISQIKKITRENFEKLLGKDIRFIKQITYLS